jgi:LacI family transcriptional regulator
MPTLLDVARRAGVSPMTVSRVVNGSSSVSPETRARVELALSETGYLPNTLARGLRARRTDTIALLLPDMTNPFFTTLAQGVERTARGRGISLLLANTDEQEDEETRLLPMLLQRQVDGLLVVPAGSGAAAIRLCAEQRVPLVLVDRRPDEVVVDTVRADSRGGAMELGRLLTALGHRHLAVLSGPASVATARDRVAGFHTAVADEAGLPEPRVIDGAYTIESGRAMASAAMRGTPRPTALFAVNNFIAIGALHALEELGLRVPEDVAVVGFDDLPRPMVTFPFLTVATQPALEIGQRAVAMLLDRMMHPDRPPRDLVLPTEVVIRRSSGGQRNGGTEPGMAATGVMAGLRRRAERT